MRSISKSLHEYFSKENELKRQEEKLDREIANLKVQSRILDKKAERDKLKAALVTKKAS